MVENICGLHRDLWAHECVVSNGGGKWVGLHKDFQAYDYVVSNGGEIDGVI